MTLDSIHNQFLRCFIVQLYILSGKKTFDGDMILVIWDRCMQKIASHDSQINDGSSGSSSKRVKHHAAQISCSKCVRLEPDIRVITCPYINIRGKNEENCALSSPQLVEQTKECRPAVVNADKKIITLL